MNIETTKKTVKMYAMEVETIDGKTHTHFNIHTIKTNTPDTGKYLQINPTTRVNMPELPNYHDLGITEQLADGWQYLSSLTTTYPAGSWTTATQYNTKEAYESSHPETLTYIVAESGNVITALQGEKKLADFLTERIDRELDMLEQVYGNLVSAEMIYQTIAGYGIKAYDAAGESKPCADVRKNEVVISHREIPGYIGHPIETPATIKPRWINGYNIY